MASSGSVSLVEAVVRAVDILERLAASDNGLRLTELSAQLNLPHPTVYRLLHTLKHKGLVEQDEGTSRYYLSNQILHLQANVIKRFNLVEQAVPILNHMVQQLQETANLAILSDLEVVYLEQRRYDRYFSIYTPVGRRAPVYCQALGKVLMAYLSRDELMERVDRIEFIPRTPSTIRTREQFLAELEQVRLRGYALDNGEIDPEIRCVAAPVRNLYGQVIASVSVSGSIRRLTDQRLPQVIPFVVAQAGEISRRIGYLTPPALPSNDE